MTETAYNEKRRLLSIAKELMSDIQQHTQSMHAALKYVNSENAESFHADEILQDTIQLEMLLEDFKGSVPEEFEPFQKEVDQRKKSYGDLFGDQWYENRRTALEEEIAEAASVPESTAAEKEYMRREARRFSPRVRREKKEKQELEKLSLEKTGKIVQIYSIEAQDQLFNFEEDKTAHPLEAKLEPEDSLFSELPEHYKIVCVEEDQQIKVDINQTIKANPFYEKDNKVLASLDDAAESGKNMFRLQKLFDQLIGEQYE